MERNGEDGTPTVHSNGCPASPQSESLTPPLRNEPLPGAIVRLADIHGLTNAMLCSVCEKVPVPPRIAACMEGHLICGPCVRALGPSLGRCIKQVEQDNEIRECGARIGRYKCQVYEYLFRHSEFRCAYADAGCQKTPMGSNLKQHDQRCPYRPTIPCPYSSCKSGLVSQFTLVQHLVSVHKISPLDSNTLRVQVVDERTNFYDPENKQDTNRWLCSLLTCYDLNFMLMAEEHKGGIYMWVSLASGAGLVNGRTFQCNISLVPENSFSSQGLTWEGEVYPLEERFEHIVSLEDTLLIKKMALSKKYIYIKDELLVWNVDFWIKEALFQGISLTMGMDGSSRNTSPRSAGKGQGTGTGTSSQYTGTDRFICSGSAPSAPSTNLYESPKSEPLILDSAYEESSPDPDQKEIATPKLTHKTPLFEVDMYQEMPLSVKSIHAQPKPQPLPRTLKRLCVESDESESEYPESDVTIVVLDDDEATSPESEIMYESPQPDSPRPPENSFLPIAGQCPRTTTDPPSPQPDSPRPPENEFLPTAGHCPRTTTDPPNTSGPAPSTFQGPRRKVVARELAMQQLQELISRVDFSRGCKQ